MERFLVLRFEKVKSLEELAARIGHNCRDLTPDNANAKLSHLNYDLIGTGIALGVPNGQEVLKVRERRLKICGNPKPLKSRKPFSKPSPERLKAAKTSRARKRLVNKHGNDGVFAIEAVVTASHDYMASLAPPDRRAFFERAKTFFDAKFGEDNGLQFVIHEDELTTNGHGMYLPLVKSVDRRTVAGREGLPIWKYSAFALIGGDDERLKEWQTEFWQHMRAGGFDVDRGVEGSTATHESTRNGFAAMKRKQQEAEERCRMADVAIAEAEEAKAAAAKLEAELELEIEKAKQAATASQRAEIAFRILERQVAETKTKIDKLEERAKEREVAQEQWLARVKEAIAEYDDMAALVSGQLRKTVRSERDALVPLGDGWQSFATRYRLREGLGR